MTEYDVYFELYGKKMKTTVKADSETDAKVSVLNKIVFHKVEKTDPFNKIMGIFKEMMDICNK